MENIKQLENLLAGWEESYKLSMYGLDRTNEAICYGGVKALKDALKIFKRPSNTQMQIDEKPRHFSCECGWLHKDVYPGFKCECGRVFTTDP